MNVPLDRRIAFLHSHIDDVPAPRPSTEPRHRAWPRCESASTHFELGANDENQASTIRRHERVRRTGET
jgi:hypothetical protein